MRAFTLLEVLVALAIFALLAMAVARQSSSFGNQLFRLEDKTLALWVAQNALDRARIVAIAPALGETEESVELGGRQWAVHSAVTETTRPGFRRIGISVAPAGETATLIELVGYRAL